MIQDVQLWYIHFMMAIFEVTTHAPKIFSVFSWEKGVLFFIFTLLRVSPGGHFDASRVQKIEAFQRSVCTWKQQCFFLCHLLVLEPFEVDICG